MTAIKAAEKLGHSINYATDFDVDRNPDLTSKTKALVFGGHSEYWTTNMRDSVDGAVVRGVNLIVFGAIWIETLRSFGKNTIKDTFLGSRRKIFLRGLDCPHF